MFFINGLDSKLEIHKLQLQTVHLVQPDYVIINIKDFKENYSYPTVTATNNQDCDIQSLFCHHPISSQTLSFPLSFRYK